DCHSTCSCFFNSRHQSIRAMPGNRLLKKSAILQSSRILSSFHSFPTLPSRPSDCHYLLMPFQSDNSLSSFLSATRLCHGNFYCHSACMGCR
ncbi:hypothetical protein PFISCL1PPCAC_19313, partial [Pristionchus fissidentatus]